MKNSADPAVACVPAGTWVRDQTNEWRDSQWIRSRRVGAPPGLAPLAGALSFLRATRLGRPSSRALDVACCAGAYLYGSLPVVYALARRREVDLKRVGSGNVGATNLLASVGATEATSGWIFDASKGLAPILVVGSLGRSRAVAEVAGVCGVAGQCWPLFLRFSGGRGISAFVGAGAGMDRVAWASSLLPMICGSLWRIVPRLGHLRLLAGKDTRISPAETEAGMCSPVSKVRSKSVPLGCFLSAVAFPLLVGMRRRFRPGAIVAPTLLSCVILVRRLTAAQPDDATNGPVVHPKALLYRLLYDRNTSD